MLSLEKRLGTGDGGGNENDSRPPLKRPQSHAVDSQRKASPVARPSRLSIPNRRRSASFSNDGGDERITLTPVDIVRAHRTLNALSSPQTAPTHRRRPSLTRPSTFTSTEAPPPQTTIAHDEHRQDEHRRSITDTAIMTHLIISPPPLTESLQPPSTVDTETSTSSTIAAGNGAVPAASELEFDPKRRITVGDWFIESPRSSKSPRSPRSPRSPFGTGIARRKPHTNGNSQYNERETNGAPQAEQTVITDTDNAEGTPYDGDQHRALPPLDTNTAAESPSDISTHSTKLSSDTTTNAAHIIIDTPKKLSAPVSSALSSPSSLFTFLQQTFSPLLPSISKTSSSPSASDVAKNGDQESSALAERMSRMFGDTERLAQSVRSTSSTTTILLHYIRTHILHTCILIIILLQVYYIPLRLAFGSTRAGISSHLDTLHDYDIILDGIFIISIIFVDYIEPFTWKPRLLVRAHHMRRQLIWSVAMDIISSLPYGLLVTLVWHNVEQSTTTMAGDDALTTTSSWFDVEQTTHVRLTALYLLPRLLRLPRLIQYLDTLETINLVQDIVNPTLFRLIKLGLTLFVLAHLTGCLHYTLSWMEGFPDDNDWIVPKHIRESPSLYHQYSHAVYWGFSCMTSGPGVEAPVTAVEHWYTLMVMLVGVSAYATLIGNLSGIIQQLNSKTEDYRTKMTDMSELMNAYQLPAELQHRVKSCFMYSQGMMSQLPSTITDDNAITQNNHHNNNAERPRNSTNMESLDLLPAYLRNELLCHIHGEIITKVPLFRDCSDGFMRSLVPLLKPEVVIPGDYIIRTGEIGREMYLIRHGQLEVIAHGQVVATLSDGSYVGEVAIIFEQKRTASVRAVSFCDILVLSKEDFDNVLSQYPEVQRTIRMQAVMRKNARSLQDKQVRADKEKESGTPPSEDSSTAELRRPTPKSRPIIVQKSKQTSVDTPTTKTIRSASATNKTNGDGTPISMTPSSSRRQSSETHLISSKIANVEAEDISSTKWKKVRLLTRGK